MKRSALTTILRWIWLFILFASASSVGWMDMYYEAMAEFYWQNEDLALARAYARDFEKIYHRQPSIPELIPFAERRFDEDLEKMDYAPGCMPFWW